MRLSLFPLFLLLLPLAEIAGFVVVGREIGALATVGLVILSSVAGSLLLRHQGFGVMTRVRAEMDAGHDPSRQLAHGAM
ncbi:membrane protein FxsA, partial [Mesorhizobium sp. M4B.F.Ca.ET.169.01.1.1]|uniref:FxsA family protein n=1 Tax=Mesorhizobium sp. M4B.F.Ca.ET.169.01.1.1 TaxID=2563949 RepID=UPI00113B1141